MRLRHHLTAATAAVVVLTLSLTVRTAEAATPPPIAGFDHVTQYTVSGSVAEIVAASPDGETIAYSDSAQGEIGFVDIKPAGTPTELGTVPVLGSPTSVAFTTDGEWVLAGVDGTDDTLVVIDASSRTIEETLVLSGQPDSIAMSADGRYAAIAIENQRDEGVNEGLMPQLPGGNLAIVDLAASPDDWEIRTVDLTNVADRFPTDPEPEFVDIRDGMAALTLQENNHIVLIRLSDGAIIRDFPAGSTTHRADLIDNDTISLTQSMTARREPDAIHWTPHGRLYTANEGDYGLDLAPGEVSGGRNFTLYGQGGAVRFEVGRALEQATVNAGRYDDGRSDNKGTEPEGIEIATYGDRTFLFVGMERADAVAVYRLTGLDELPVLVEVLSTGDRPEGLLAIPNRRLFVSANEDDGTIDIFRAHR